MTASLLHGKLIAENRKKDIQQAVTDFSNKYHRTPTLAVILVGDDKASQIYVNNKRKACTEVGIGSEAFLLTADISEENLLQHIHNLNKRPTIDGILVQLPLPRHINTEKIIEAIAPQKDVDGFHPYNFGHLAQRHPLLRPCTPMGIMQLLEAYAIPVKGKHAVVVGASNIVGRPMALEFLHAGATVTVCHRFTQNLQPFVSQAEILVVATGVQDLINPDWLSKNQIVIDVGMHRLESGKIRGDLNFESVSKKVSWLTPVPGGVGPMTIVSLLENTLLAAQIVMSHSHE